MIQILFPTDFSVASDSALTYLFTFARVLQAKIHFLHTYELPRVKGAGNLPNTMEDIFNDIKAEAASNLEKFKTKIHHTVLKENFPQKNLEFLIAEGEIIPAILNKAKQLKADLIVMGTEGAWGLKEIFVGSIAGEIIENASCPTLVIPKDAKFSGQIKKIAVTTSFKEDEKIALQKVLDLSKLLNAQVFCINVDLSHSEFFMHRMDALKEQFKDHSNLFFQVLEGTSLHEEIAEYLENNQIDLLAMLTHKRNLLGELFNYSQTKKMVYHTQTPVLVYQAHALNA